MHRAENATVSHAQFIMVFEVTSNKRTFSILRLWIYHFTRLPRVSLVVNFVIRSGYQQIGSF